MDTFGILGQIIPEHVGIFEMGLGVTLLGVDEVREFGWVTNKEHWSVIEDPVEISFFSADFDGKTTRIAGGIGRTRFTTDCRETDSCFGFCADLSISLVPMFTGNRGGYLLEERSAGKVTNIMGYFEVTVGSSTLGMYNTLWDTFPVKVGEEIDMVEVYNG